MGFHKNLRGLDLHAPSQELMENNSGTTITKMKVIALDGVGTLYPQVRLANPAVYSNFGIAAENIDDGSIGYVMCLGFMFRVNTSQWEKGTMLYSDSSGDLTSSPNINPVAQVVNQGINDGVIYVLGAAVSAQLPSAWDINGNNAQSSNFIGTINNIPLNFKTNNENRITISQDGKVGIGTSQPETIFEIKENDVRYNVLTSAPLTSGAQSVKAMCITPSINSVEFFKIFITGIDDSLNSLALERTVRIRNAADVVSLYDVQSDYTSIDESLQGITCEFQVDQLNVNVNVGGIEGANISWKIVATRIS